MSRRYGLAWRAAQLVEQLFDEIPKKKPDMRSGMRALFAAVAFATALTNTDFGFADNSRATRELAIRLKHMETNPGSLEAELDLFAIFKLWDKVGKEPVIRALKRAASSKGSSANFREQAKHLLNQTMVRTGNIDGAMAGYERQGMLSDWLVTGPFDNEGGTGFEASYPPEEMKSKAFDPAAPMPGKNGDVLFRKAPKEIAPFGYNHLEALIEPDVNVCAYAATTVYAEEGGSAVLRIGAGGAFKAFWNGRMALSDPAYRRPGPDRHAAAVQVRRGNNRLLVKICAEQDAYLGFYARVTDRAGHPWKLSAAKDQIQALIAPVPEGSETKPIAQPVDLLVARADKNTNNAAFQLAAARYLYETGAMDHSSHKARDLARRACELAPGVDACLLWADLALDRNERRLAIDRACASDERSVEAILAQAELEIQGPEPNRSLPLLKKALKLQPDDMEASALETNLLEAQGFAMTAFERARALADKYPGIPYIINLAADLAQSAGRTSEGLALTRKSLEIHFHEQGKHMALARAAAERGDMSELRNRIGILKRLAPYDSDICKFASLLLEGAGEIEAAGRELEFGVHLAPLDAEAQKDLGLFLMRNGRRDEGIEALSKAVSISPQDVWLKGYLDRIVPASRLENRFFVPQERFLAERKTAGDGEAERYLVDLTVVRVFESGLCSRFVQTAVQVKNNASAQTWRRHWIHFSPETQRVKILTARILRSDGSIENATGRYTVPVSEPWYRLYYDVAAEVIELPPVNPGDVVEFRYSVDDISHRNAFNDYFGDLAFVQDESPRNLWRYVLVAPASRHFYFHKPAIEGFREKSEIQDRDVVTVFEALDVPAIKQESLMPGLNAGAAYLHVSTYASWEELGKWYMGLIRHQLKPDARIRDKVRELTSGSKNEIQKVKAIYDWVVTATRYVGLEFGIHGYQPYRAPLVVSRGFGDCKDKAALLVTMLEEAGVEADFVLLRTRRLGKIELFPASLAVFDHAIAYVPSLDLWLDGTAEHHGTSELPFQDQDATALRLSPEGAEIVHSPIMPAASNANHEKLNVVLDPSGDAKIESESSILGEQAAALRSDFEAKGTRRERFENSLAEVYPGARLNELEFKEPLDLEQPVTYKYSAFIPSFGKSSSDTLEIPLDTGVNLMERFGRLPSRTCDLVVGPKGLSSRESTIRVPSGYQIELLPAAASIESAYGKLSLQIRKQNGTIRVLRRFELDVHEISTANYPDFLEFSRSVDEKLSQRIIMKRQ